VREKEVYDLGYLEVFSMILGYLIFLGSGALIKHSFKIERAKGCFSVTNGLAALITFSKKL